MFRFLIYISFILSFSFYSKAQTINLVTGNVESYAKLKNASDIPEVIDTIVGQYRSFAIDTIARKIGIEFVIENDTIRVQYYIEKIYMTDHYNSYNGTKSSNINLLSFDSENYPLLVLLPLEHKNLIYLYYYWSDKDESFQKCEKVVVKSNSELNFKN
jgi:hypothetical protein